MKAIWDLLTGKGSNGLRLEKSRFSEDWFVKKGYQTLYIGTKEKCQIFMSQGV